MTFYYAPQTASVKKPKSLAASEVATTTATLGWTNGSDETAWQISYLKGDPDFDPDTEGTKVTVSANPFTLTGLTASTTYYAYIRAEKGGEYSAWSNMAEFTTLSATPIMELSTTSISFGIVSDAAAQAQTFTVSNTGGVDLNAFSVKPAGDGFKVTDTEGNELPQTIAAGETLTVKVVMTALGEHTVDFIVAGNDLEDQRVTVSGYMLDDTKIAETFASKPDRWTASSGWSYNATTGAYSTTYGGSTLTSPKIVVGEGETLIISAKSGYAGESYYVKIEGSSDNGSTWTAYSKQLSTASDPALSTTDFTFVTLNDVPTTVNRLRITAYYGYINALNGFTYDEDPQLALYSDEACTTSQAATATKNWGFVADAQQQKYYIKNTGNGQIDLTIAQADGFTAAVDDAALTEGEKATLTIDMAAAEGLHEGTVTVTATNHKTNEVLGTFAVTLNAGVAGSKNDIDFVGGALSELPAGWETTGWTVSNSSYVGVSSTASDLTSQEFTVGDGETLLIEAKTTNLSWYTPELSYSYKVGNGDWSTATEMSGFANDYKVFAITGIPAGQARIKFTGKYIQIRRIYGFEAASVPVMVFSVTDKTFGMVTANTTSDAYTITNSGAGVLNGLSVTCDNDNFEIAVADNATEIAAGGTATFTVTLKANTQGLHQGVVTVAGTDVESKTFNVSGYVADGTKIFTTFTALPENWTNTGNYWSFSENGATATSSSSKLETPKIKITEGEKLAISAMQRYSGSRYNVTINGSSDNGATWTAYTKTLNDTQLSNTTYTIVELDDIPTTVNKLQLVGNYVYVNGFNGFSYDDNDPQLGVFSDAEFASAITTGSATNAWGFVSEDKTATYYIKNTGTGTMTLTKTDAPAGFTATLGAASLGAGESTTLVIAMANDAENNEGYHAGDVVLTAKDNADNELSTFTVTSSGVVVGAKTDINFTTLDAFPGGWETTTWTVTANEKATVGYSTGTLTTGTYSVADGEKMVVLAKRSSSWGSLSYKTSTDGGATWSDATTITPSSTSEYELKVIEGIAAGDNVKIEFTGYYADIQRIYGYTSIAKPSMALSPADASYDFGMQTAAAEYVITVTNNGTADMENLAAALTTTDYEAEVSKTTLAPAETATITVTQKYDASKGLASLSDVLTISADGVASKTINLSGKTRDASKLFVDFDNVALPDTWNNEGWTVYNYGSDNYLYNSSNTTAYAVTTQALTVTEGESISFDVKAYSSYGSPYLTVRYSYNGGIDWTDFATYAYSDETLTTSFATKTISGLNAGKVILQFVGTYCGIDNIIGLAPKADEPTISVKKSSATINNGDTEAFGSIKDEAAATYTIKNIGQGTLTITETTATGEATAEVTAASLAAGASATLTITMPVAAPYEYKEGAVTVKTSLGDFIINYNATVLNPNALDEQFASGQPAGWYFGGYWEVSSRRAENTASGVADLITEQVTVAGTSDALTFQAAKTGSSAATFKVYTSQDRVNWTEVDLNGLTLTTDYQDVTISGLAAGDYYVKIEGARVKVDNFLGWTKKNNAHDLYVTATSIPSTLAADYTATATVTSLRAAEEGVYAKLFFGETEMATAEAASVALNTSTTLTMTFAEAPAEALYEAKIVIYYSDGTVAFTTGTTKVGTLVLNDTEAFTAEADTYGTVKLNRTFNAGKWNTVCLPFAAGDVTSFFGDGAVAYAFTGYENEELQFAQVYSLRAGVPYVVYVAEGENISEKTVSNVTLIDTPTNVEQNEVQFIGTFDPIAKGSMTGNYGVTSDGHIQKAGSNASIKGFRAYFDLNGNEVKALRFGDIETGVRVINLDSNEAQQIFDLSGRKINKTQQGIYIVNGKKVSVK